MDKPRSSRFRRIVAIAVILLPALYVVSYFSMVVPGGTYRVCISGRQPGSWLQGHYRFPFSDGNIFWPLEQIDRTLRPQAWEPSPPSGLWFFADEKTPPRLIP